jgi:hypothetical protein
MNVRAFKACVAIVLVGSQARFCGAVQGRVSLEDFELVCFGCSRAAS